jgi:type IV pilus assembly protein PilW
MRVIRPGRAQRGVTLVELLVSLVMGLVLLAGVATVFLANKETFRVQEAVASGQENGRFALSVITRDLRSSGHWGCNSVRGTLPIDRVATPANSQFGSFDRAVFAYRVDSGGAWTPPRDVQFTSGSPPVPVNDSDVIVIRALRGVEVRVTGQTAATAPISFRGCTDLQTGHTALVSDCTASAVFNVTNVTASCNGTIVHGVDLGKQFPSAGQPAEVQRIENVAYFVATSANGRPALFRWNGVGAAEELVEGIERLRVRFGVDTSAPGDGAVDAYLDPSDASIDWDRVMNVRVTLVTTSSEQGITGGAQSYLMEVRGSSVFSRTAPTTDTRLRQVYSETVAVRNRQS